ncbi:homoserine kinase [Pullulanibacillus pueri]|uniref:Homoserine kinase n=1 Tax=Pullulanibacillus pueri TaxID=1437324 RepID=A0A8J2ZV16_9BACL|nr:homoserine kinase [Pullulanibacillus pueri]MBM7682347.1 homoserine kinase [Pullulanibacillus pueri]GGH80710.1 homoserine kinase [Pullulanibacillus pueri]
MEKWRIKVPGSTANLGSGFDSIGLAVNRYMTLEATPSSGDWSFTYKTPGYEELPNGKENLIYKAFAYTLKTLGLHEGKKACHVEVETELPLARGLGSSATAIVAGIELANLLYSLSLASSQKVRIASMYEGHPDNAAASVYGGVTIGTHHDDETFVIPCGAVDFNILLLIPDHQLLTQTSRSVLPEVLSFRQAVQGSSVANVLVAALLTGDLELAGKMMTKDVFHQPYRAKIVPYLKEIMDYAMHHDQDIYGVALSGAGPALMCFIKPGTETFVIPQLNEAFPYFQIEQLKIDSFGVTVEGL